MEESQREEQEAGCAERQRALRTVVSIGAALVFVLISWLMISGRTEDIDRELGEFARSTRGPVTNVIWITVTYAAYKWTIVSEAAVLILLPRTRRNMGIPAGVTSALGLVVYKGLKQLFARHRPDSALWLIPETGFSFPSGHSMNGLIWYGMMIYMIRKYMKNRKAANVLTVLLVLLILGIGWSRIFVSVHYASDVAAGFAAGLCWLMAAVEIMEKKEEAGFEKNFAKPKNGSEAE